MMNLSVLTQGRGLVGTRPSSEQTARGRQHCLDAAHQHQPKSLSRLPGNPLYLLLKVSVVQSRPTPHQTKKETAADPYSFWHSADHSTGGNCFNAAGSNLSNFLMPGSQMIKVHPKPQGLARAGGENSPGWVHDWVSNQCLAMPWSLCQ